MKVTHLTDTELLKDTRISSENERQALSELLAYFEEVDRRKVYCDLGYESLYSYCIKELRYSESESYKRVQATRLLQLHPEVGGLIASGALSLSNATLLHKYFHRKKINSEEQKQLINLSTNKTSKECEKILFMHDDLGMNQKRVLKIEVEERVYEKWLKVKGLMAHMTLEENEVFERMLDEFIITKDRANKNLRNEAKSEVLVGTYESDKRYIPAFLERKLWQRARSQCEYCDQKTGKRCQSAFALEIHHLTPYAIGGKTSLNNLKLFCRQHNQREKIKVFGNKVKTLPQGFDLKKAATKNQLLSKPSP